MTEQTPYPEPGVPAEHDGTPGQYPTTDPAHPAATTTEPPRRAVSVGQILAGILLVLVVIFIAENTDDVKIRIIAGPKVNAPVFVWLLIAAVVGALIAALMRARRRHSAKIKAAAKQNR